MTVYLIHLDEAVGNPNNPRARARHYIGYTKRDTVENRIARHRRSAGSRLLRAANLQGITWKVVRVWEGGRELEIALKRRHQSSDFCPVCNPECASELYIPPIDELIENAVNIVKETTALAFGVDPREFPF